MKVQLFEIVPDDLAENPQSVYYSGQTVTFKVHLQLTAPVKCRAINIKLYGSSYVHWTEIKVRSIDIGETITYLQRKHYRSEEIFIDRKFTIFAPEISGPNAEHHPAGEYFYPVTFQIPTTAPSSYEGGRIGRIRYFMKANIDRPWKIDNYTQKFYTVIRQLDLNTMSADKVGPFSTENQFNVNCCYLFGCCCGKVRVSVTLPRKGYVPGELICVTGSITNTSMTDLNSVNLEIYQRSQFHVPKSGKTRTTTRVASYLKLPCVPKGQTLKLDHQVPVKPVPSSLIEGGNNIEVFYYFRLNVNGGYFLKMKEECCELVIGTVPLRSSLRPLSSSGSQQGYDGPMPAGSDPLPDAIPSPQTYEECTFGPVEMDKEEGKNSAGAIAWAPSYPVYALPSA